MTKQEYGRVFSRRAVNGWLRTGILLALAMLLAGCQLLSPGPAARSVPPAAFQKPATGQPSKTPQPVENTAAPTPTLTSLPVTETPSQSGIPALLVGLPAPDQARLDPLQNVAQPTKAAVVYRVKQNPADLDAFYQRELESQGWTLRYAEGTPVGGFIQEWKKGSRYLTVEYYFAEDQLPALSIEVRDIDSKQALTPLLGFPLPNGTEVIRADGPTLELYVPQDLNSTVEFFKTQLWNRHLIIFETDQKPPCVYHICTGIPLDAYSKNVSLMPAATPDSRKVPSYRTTLPDKTQAKLAFLPHRGSTRVFVQVNFLNPYRSNLPLLPYPGATLLSVTPITMILETADPLDKVVEYYENGLMGMGWTVKKDGTIIDEPDKYSKIWLKDSKTITLGMTRTNGKVTATITCRGCSSQ